MPDPVSQALQFWGNLDFHRPTRDAQLAQWAQLLSDEQAKSRGTGAYTKALAGLAEGDPDDAKLKGQSELVKILGQSGALDTSPMFPVSPDQSGAQSRSSAANVQTFPLAPPPPIQGMQLPLTPPQGVAPVTPPTPGQASVPMQAPGPASLLPSHSQAFLAAQPPQARQAALQALLANAMGRQRVTTHAPGAPTGAGGTPPGPSAGNAGAVGPGASVGAGTPAGPGAGTMPPGWQPLRGPQIPQGSPTGERSDLPLGGRGVQPAKMPSVPMMAKKLLDSGLDPQAAYYALQDYEKVQDRETKQAMEGLRTQANIYRAGVTAMRYEAMRQRDEQSHLDRAASLAERKQRDREMAAHEGGKGGTGAPSLSHLNPLLAQERSEIKPVADAQMAIQEIRGLIATDDPAAKPQIQKQLTQFLQRGPRTNAIYADVSSFGDVYARMANGLSRWYEGDYSDKNKQLIMNMLTKIDDEVLAPYRKRVIGRYQKIGKRFGYEPEDLDIPSPIPDQDTAPSTTPATGSSATSGLPQGWSMKVIRK